MKRLELPQERLRVRRTGLPFYDAARVIGVAQLFFGTAGAEVRETGFGWEISGVADRTEPPAIRPYLQRFWIGERLRRFERKPNNLDRLVRWQSADAGRKTKLEAQWEAVRDYFQKPFAAPTGTRENTTGLMDSALALGARGSDSSGYDDFAAQSGTPSQEPEAETLAALLGLSHAARVNNAVCVLPIFGHPDRDATRDSYPVTTARYWNYNRTFTHEGGERIAAIWAMLSMLETLADANLPVKDFAYNRADRPIYHSGTLGAERMCRNWRVCEGVLREVGQFLQATQCEKGGHAVDLARALADFALLPDPEGLERVVRLKARAMADDDSRGKTLFRNPETLEEIKKIMSVPKLPEPLCRAVWRALSPSEQNKGWISGYMKLENATTPHRFFEEIERLISRAKMDRDLYYGAEAGEKSIPDYINELASSPRDYRAFRAAFLLRVLQVPAKAEQGITEAAVLLAEEATDENEEETEE